MNMCGDLTLRMPEPNTGFVEARMSKIQELFKDF